MSLVKNCFRAMEYIPFAGIIPGALRISDTCVINKNSMIAIIADTCLSPCRSDSVSFIRGFVSVIPGINLALIPFDLVNLIIRKTSNHKK